MYEQNRCHKRPWGFCCCPLRAWGVFFCCCPLRAWGILFCIPLRQGLSCPGHVFPQLDWSPPVCLPWSWEHTGAWVCCITAGTATLVPEMAQKSSYLLTIFLVLFFQRQSGLKLTVWTRLDSNSQQSSCLRFPTLNMFLKM